jgi:hypothetical protein
MRWTYRVVGPAERQGLTTTVLEEHPETPGVFQVRVELDGGLTATGSVTVTPTAVLVHRDKSPTAGSATMRASVTPGPPSEVAAWQKQIALPAELPDGPQAGETIHVPAGEFHTVRATQLGADGRPVAQLWLAPGVGIVRRVWEQNGLAEELETLRRPAEEPAEEEPAEEEPGKVR